MRDNIVALIKEGHDVAFNAIMTLYPVEFEEGDRKYRIEIYDPIDDDTQELLHGTFIGCELMQKFFRNNDYWESELTSPEEAADLYLDVSNWLKEPLQPQIGGIPLPASKKFL